MSCEGVTVNTNRIEEVVKASIRAMKNKEGLFAFVDPQPEKAFIELAKVKGSDFALNATFLISTMVLGGQTEPFFRKISIPERFNEYSWLFEPNEVIKRSNEEVIDACKNYFLPAGRQAEPIPQWRYNCQILANNYGGSVKNYFGMRDNDALKIYGDLIVRPRAKTYEKEIRRFGPKITKLMIQWVREYGLYDLKNTDDVGVPIDFQLGRVMIQTEGLKLDRPVNTHFIVHKVLPIIFDDLRLKGYRPEDISKSLWAIGSGGCKYKKHDLCPLENLCSSLISTFRYDRDGLFDPRDVGRFDQPTSKP